MENKRFYVAYGSNLNLRQMAHRCPTARVYSHGKLKDYQLTFCTFLTIEPKLGAETPVGIWEIQPKDEKSLDFYEGYPRFYRKEMVTVETPNGDLQAMVYIMNEGKPNLPSLTYYDVVATGYKEIGLDLSYLEGALKDTQQKMGQ